MLTKEANDLLFRTKRPDTITIQQDSGTAIANFDTRKVKRLLGGEMC